MFAVNFVTLLQYAGFNLINPFLTWPRGCKTFFMLNSVEHESLNAHKYKNIYKKSAFLGPVKPNWVEHEKGFITSDPVNLSIL